MSLMIYKPSVEAYSARRKWRLWGSEPVWGQNLLFVVFCNVRKGLAGLGAFSHGTERFYGTGGSGAGRTGKQREDGRDERMNIFARLEDDREFSENERIVAAYILRDPVRFLEQGGKEIERECFVSQATIYRLCEKLGLAGLSELKVKVSGSLKDYLSRKGTDFDYDFPVKRGQTLYEAVNGLREDYEETVRETAGLFQTEELGRAVEAMRKAKVIDVYTSAGNIFFAENFQFQMREIGVPVQVPVEEYQQRLTAASGDGSHFAVVISFGGRGMLTDGICRLLRENGTPFLLISSREYRPEEPKPDFHIFLASGENHFHKMSSFSTRLSLLFVLDVLYTGYFQTDYDGFLERKLSYYKKIAGMRGRE